MTPGERRPGAPRRGDPFGDLLPQHTRDEDPRGWGEDDHDTDEDLRREVPPHHA